MSMPYSFRHPTIIAIFHRLKNSPASAVLLQFHTGIQRQGTQQAIDWLLSRAMVECCEIIGKGNNKTKIYQLTVAGWL